MEVGIVALAIGDRSTSRTTISRNHHIFESQASKNAPIEVTVKYQTPHQPLLQPVLAIVVKLSSVSRLFK
jgi:hypothetical protein